MVQAGLACPGKAGGAQRLTDIFFFLSLLTFLAMGIGIFKPSPVLPPSRSGAKPTPTRAATVYLVATLANMVGVIVSKL